MVGNERRTDIIMGTSHYFPKRNGERQNAKVPNLQGAPRASRLSQGRKRSQVNEKPKEIPPKGHPFKVHSLCDTRNSSHGINQYLRRWIHHLGVRKKRTAIHPRMKGSKKHKFGPRRVTNAPSESTVASRRNGDRPTAKGRHLRRGRRRKTTDSAG
jgi:hypothetical protein